MRIVLQRVTRASVSVGGTTTGEIGKGLLLLVGITHDDTPEEAVWMSDKVVGLRVFPDQEGKMNLSVRDAGGEILVVSQFTLYGDTARGRRPSFVNAAKPEIAIALYDRFVSALEDQAVRVTTGVFGADMQVELLNDGPVTLVLDRNHSDA